MKWTEQHLHQPVELACRRAVRSLLATVATAAQRLGDPSDADALHDFRVAVRRLDTSLRGYRTYLPKRVATVLRKRLRALVSSTNAGRDDEVHIWWLGGQLERRVPQLPRRGYEIVLDELRDRAPAGPIVPAEPLQERFSDIRTRIEDRFTRKPEAIRLDAAGASVTFGRAAGQVVDAHGQALREELGLVASLENRKRAHRARLAAKRLRYLLEPLRVAVPGSRDAVARLKGLQTVLGDLRDLQILEMRIRSSLERAGTEWSRQLAETAVADHRISSLTRGAPSVDDCLALAAALQRIRAYQTRLYRNFERRWTADRATAFFRLVDRIISGLGVTPTPTPAPVVDPPSPDPQPPPPQNDSPAPAPTDLPESAEVTGLPTL